MTEASNSEADKTQPKLHVDGRYVTSLQKVIHGAVRVLAALMVIVIVMGVVDVGWILWQKLREPPGFILTVSDLLATFAAFMAVFIAIEIFENITIYLREDIIHVEIVMATALMAIARKVIILDLDTTDSADLVGIAAIVLAISIGYWMVRSRNAQSHGGDVRNGDVQGERDAPTD